MTIQAVFFDMGGTIEIMGFTHELRLDATSAIRQRLREVGINLSLSNEQLCEVIVKGVDAYKRWCIPSMVELPPQRVWREFVFAGYPFDLSKLDPIAEDLTFCFETRFFQRQMRPEIPGVLEAIKQMGLKIGLISNVNSREQVPCNLVEYGIRHYFDPVVLSCEYGRRKPDPAIFHYAARLAHVPTSACLYVGDRIIRDIEGAQRAGFGKAIQIHHDFDHGEIDEGATPDAKIESFTELIDILKDELTHCTRPTPHPIRGILFDAGDILYYRPGKGSHLASYLRELGINPVPDHAAEKDLLLQRAYRGLITQDEYRESLLHLYGIKEPKQIQLAKRTMEQDEDNIQFFEGVQQTLISLKEKGYFLGIITDTANPVHAKLRWFERGGFGHVWDSIISSKEVGIRKPDPAIYCAALTQLGISAENAAFVGHKTSELEGARAVGMRTIAFNPDQDAQADYFVTRFSDILKVPILS